MPNRPGAKGEPISVRNLPRREYATERRMVTEEREFSGRKERSMLENTTRRYDSVNTKLQKVHSSVICLTKRKGSLLKTNYDKPTQAGANLASIVETRSPKRLLQKNGELGKNCKIKKSEKSQSSHQILNQVHEGVNAAHLHKLKDIERKKEQHEPHSKIEKHSDRAPKLKC